MPVERRGRVNERLFYVEERNGHVLASNMTLANALLFIEAYLTKYYRDYVDLIISEHSRAKAEGEDK